MLLNFDVHDVPRQALAQQFSDFLHTTIDRCVAGEIIADGRERPVPGSDAAYLLRLDPHSPDGVHGRVDYRGVRTPWTPDFRGKGDLDPALLVWCAGGALGYREVPTVLHGIDQWRFLRGARLRCRRTLTEAAIVGVRPLALACSAARPETLAEVQVVVDTEFGRHALCLPCCDGAVPPGCGLLQSGGRALLALRRYGLGAAAVVAVLPPDRLAQAVREREAA